MSEEMTIPAIDKLAAALAKAQGQFPPVPKTGKNPHLKNEYATMDDIINTVRNPLAVNGLAFVQLLGDNEVGPTLRTMLIHESGQYLSSTTSIGSISGNRAVNDLQTLGMGITYMKRYALAAMLGIATETDADGESVRRVASSPVPQATATQSPAQPKPPAIRKPGQGPQPPLVVRDVIRTRGSWVTMGDGLVRNVGETDPIHADTRQHVAATLIEALQFEGATEQDLADNAKVLLNWLFGVEASSALTEAEGKAIEYAWMKPGGGPNEYAIEVNTALVEALLVEALEETEER